MTGKISDSPSIEQLTGLAHRLRRETSAEETRIAMMALNCLAESREPASPLPKQWRKLVDHVRSMEISERRRFVSRMNERTNTPSEPDSEQAVEPPGAPFQPEGRLSFPEDRYWQDPEKPLGEPLSAEQCEEYCKKLAGEGAVKLALQLCERAVEKYRKQGNLGKVHSLRAFAATELGTAIHPALKKSFVSRESSQEGTYVSRADAGSVKVGTLHGERRKIVSADGKERECCVLDFQLVHAEQERRDLWLHSYNEAEKEKLQVLDAKEKEFLDKIDSVGFERLDDPEVAQRMKAWDDERKQISARKKALADDILLHRLDEDVQGTSRYLPGQYRSIECRYEKIAYPFFRDGHYDEGQNFYVVDEKRPQFKKEMVVEFRGIGKIRLGIDQTCTSSYGSVSVELFDPSSPKVMEQAHIMLASVGLGACLTQGGPADLMRTEVLHLFRSFYPRSAFEIEKEKSSFEIPVSSLRRKIIEKEPGMEKIFKKYFFDHPELIQEEEVFPGSSTFNIQDFGDLVRESGGIGLIAGITSRTFEETAEALCQICENGAWSTKERFQRGIIVEGASPQADFTSGGADSVFTRMVTATMIAEDATISTSPLFSVQVLYDLDAVGLCGTYGYGHDCYGIRSKFFGHLEYSQRQSLPELAETLSRTSNEVMIRRRISPKYIRRIVVQNPEERENIISVIRKRGLLEKRGDVEYFHGRSVQEFITVADQFSEDLWRSSGTPFGGREQ